MIRVAIIAALEREIAPLVRGWTRGVVASQGRKLACHRQGELVAMAGGIGWRQAEAAARAAMAEFHPGALISAGFAGAIIPSLKTGSIFIPNVIIDATTGAEYRSIGGAGEGFPGGVLVTAGEIASPESKLQLAGRFHALAVDMEAAAVARVAQETKAGFVCVKAISDEFGARLPPMERFVDAAGRFQTRRFAAWTGLRPQWWPATVRLARDSRRAAHALCGWMAGRLDRGFAAPQVVTLKGADTTNP